MMIVHRCVLLLSFDAVCRLCLQVFLSEGE